MATRTHVVKLCQVGDVETGAWCDTCLLPSAVLLRWVMMVGDRVLGEHLTKICHDCGASSEEEGES